LGGIVPPSALVVNDIHSALGRFGARVGTSFESGSLILQPFATASVLHEFQGAVTANATLNPGANPIINPTGAPITATVSTNGLGTYEQFALGVAGQVAKTGWLGYVRGDYRTGENIEGWSLNGGVRYQFDPDPVARGPMLTKAPIYKARAAQTVYNWTGFYLGGYLGADWGFTDWTFVGAGTTANPRFAGFLGGGEIGYNYQVAKWVFGVEGDLGWTNAHGARSCLTPFLFTCEIEVNWLSTETARVGYTIWDRLLVYVKGGAAVGRVGARIACNTGCPVLSDSNTKVGWTIGWGSEFGLTPNVSIKSETSYFNLGTDR
jgi:opacity protein-like surface antigen